MDNMCSLRFLLRLWLGLCRSLGRMGIRRTWLLAQGLAFSEKNVVGLEMQNIGRGLGKGVETRKEFFGMIDFQDFMALPSEPLALILAT